MESEPFYYVSDRDEVFGPWTLAEIRDHKEKGGFSESAQILINEEWTNLQTWLEIRQKLTNAFMANLRAGAYSEPELPQTERRQSVSIIDFAVFGGLWWLAILIEWRSALCLAMGFTLFTLSTLLISFCNPFFLLRHMRVVSFVYLVRQSGGLMGGVGILWLLWDIASKLL